MHLRIGLEKFCLKVSWFDETRKTICLKVFTLKSLISLLYWSLNFPKSLKYISYLFNAKNSKIVITKLKSNQPFFKRRGRQSNKDLPDGSDWLFCILGLFRIFVDTMNWFLIKNIAIIQEVEWVLCRGSKFFLPARIGLQCAVWCHSLVLKIEL